jgi:nucleoside-diphosphate-sugar epimerase
MKILLTGGSGSVGKAIIERLYKEGDEVLVIGRRESMDVGQADYSQCDINDYENLLSVSKGMDAIIHLAAIPSPGRTAPEKIFHINVTGTNNVFEAAARNGIKRITAASSINAFGYNYGRKAFTIESFPIDEETPGLTTDVYSFSKKTGEEIARYYYRCEGISSVSIRIPWVYSASEEHLDRFKNAPAKFKEVWEQLQSLPQDKRRGEIDKLISTFDQFRADRYKADFGHSPRNEESPFRTMMWGRSDFYTNIDERDCAQGFVKAVKADVEGAHTLFVNDSHNFTGLPTKELVELMYPQPEAWTGKWKKIPKETETLVSIDRARKLIGYEPEYSLKRFAK